MIKAIVIDNDEIARDIMMSHLRLTHNVHLIGVYNSIVEAIAIKNTNEVNLVFCDIQMPDLDAIVFLQSLTNPPLLVFITADLAQTVYGDKMNILDDILKPFGIEEVITATERAKAFLRHKENSEFQLNSLIINDRSNIIMTPYNEIFYVKSDKDYVLIETLEKRYKVCKNLVDIQNTLRQAKQFIRIHKSYIVNLNFAKRIDGNIMKMKGSLDDIPVDREYQTELNKRLSSF